MMEYRNDFDAPTRIRHRPGMLFDIVQELCAKPLRAWVSNTAAAGVASAVCIGDETEAYKKKFSFTLSKHVFCSLSVSPQLCLFVNLSVKVLCM